MVAVRLDLDTDGFSYRKWGATQHCKAGDWIVSADGETHTVDAESFANTYSPVSPGVYAKTGSVFAERAQVAGKMPTKEGFSDYRAGDMLVFNDAACTDGYVITAQTFESLYEPDDS